MDERNLQSSGRGRLKQPQTVKSLKPSKTVRVAREAISIAVAAIDSRGPASPASPTSPLIATGAAPKKSRFNWALYFVALQAVQTAVVLALQGLVIYRVVQFSFAALNELKNDPSLVVTYASIFIIANCAVLGMTFYAQRSRNVAVTMLIPLINAILATFPVVNYQEIRQLISCAQSWTALTRDSSNTTAMSVQLYESFNFRTCAVPSSIALSGQWFSYTAKDGTTVSLPTLLNTDSAVASVDNAVKYLDDSGPLLWLEFSIMAAFLLMSLFFSNRVRRTFVWAHFHQHGASIKKRWILMRYQTMSFVLRFQIAMAIPTSAQIIVLFFYASAVGDVPKAFTPGASDVPWTPKMYVPVQVVSTLLAIVTMFAMTVVIPWILKGQRRHLFWPILIWLLVMLGSQCVFLRTVYLDSTFLNGRIWITEFLVAHILASMATIVLFWELRADMDHGLADVIQRSWGPERERMELL